LSRELQRQILMKFVKDNWQPTFGPVAFPNAPFQTPRNSRWAEVFIVTFDTTRSSLGASSFLKRSTCSLQFNLYCPQGVGSAENVTASDFLESLFEEARFSLADGDSIQFGTPTSFDVTGVDERREGTNSNWHRSVVDCPFVRSAVVSK